MTIIRDEFAAEHRILVDLSAAAAGYTGIPHEARLILDSLWKTAGLKPTGLLYDDGAAVVCHRFGRSSDAGRRMENHAQFLFQISDQQRRNGAKSISKRTWWRVVNQTRRVLFGRGVQTQYLDNQMHGESVWRLFLEKSLSADGLELATRCPMLLSNLSRSALKLRACLRLPTFRLRVDDFDFLLMHEAMPLRVAPNVCKLVRLYDLIPGLRPDLVDSQRQIAAHLRGIRRCRHDCVFVCASEPTRADLLRAFPELEERAVVIPVVLGNQLYEERSPRRLEQIIQCRQAQSVSIRSPVKSAPPYLLTVCSIEPRKNHLTLIQAYQRLLSERDSDLILLFVGSAGWRNADVLRAMTPLIEQGKLIYLEHVPAEELRVLYTHAEAVVFPSYYEGFGYSPLEGMQCGVPAIVSDIPVHRWVYGDAASYFHPFSADDLCRAIDELVFVKRDELQPKFVENGRRRVRLYESTVIGAQWRRLCDEIRSQGGGLRINTLRLAGLDLAGDKEPAARLRLAA